MNPPSVHEDTGSVPGFVQRAEDPAWLGCGCRCSCGSHVAVPAEEAGSCSSDSTPGLGTSICRRCGPKRTTNRQTNTLNKGKKRIQP